MTRSLSALLLIGAVVLTATVGSRGTLYRCVDGVARTECCCPAPADDGGTQTVARSTCCEVTPSQIVDISPTVAAHDETVVALLIAAPPVIGFIPQPAPAPLHAFRPAIRSGPALFLLTRSFLI